MRSLPRIALAAIAAALPLLVCGCPKTIDPVVLVLYGGAVPETHAYYQNAVSLLADQGIEIETASIDDAVVYSSGDRGRYAAVVISDYNAYRDMDADAREELDDYCREFDVGQLFVYVGSGYSLNGGEVSASSGRVLSGQRVNPDSPLLSLTRDGGTINGDLPWYGRALAVYGEGYEPVALAETGDGEMPNILLDTGAYDGIVRVFHAHDFHRFWLHDLLTLDAVQYLSPVDLGIVRERWIGVDIDDIFQVNWDPVPENRTVKIQAEDVEAMIATQDLISDLMEGTFRFHLGFNMGWYEVNYGPEPYDDAAGDRALVAERDEFYWFDHLPFHPYSSDYTYDELVAMMDESQEWAQVTGVIDHMTQYQLSPYHNGIYPIHEPLYQAWRDVWDARYTSTTVISEGFSYLGILVAPRQSCGIWSSQYSFDQVSEATLMAYARGGAVFRTILEHPVNVFMTHQSNYARDRLGLVLFEELVQFLDQWTTFTLVAGPNDELVAEYFRLFPLAFAEHLDPIAFRTAGPGANAF